MTDEFPLLPSRPPTERNSTLLRQRQVIRLLVFVCAVTARPCAAGLLDPANADKYEIVHAFPHDPNAFTQGLVYANGHLYESTGLYGKSSVRLVELETGRVLQQHDLPTAYFGEGLTVWRNNLVQLTWKAKTGFVYDSFSFAVQRTFHYDTEGWGLTHNSKELILSDGSAVLHFLNPQSFQETRRLQVHDDQGRAIVNLNELEFINGEIYANVWQTDEIVRISPRSGRVLGWINLSGLIDKRELPNSDAVLNGIAYDSTLNRLFVTGKLWPTLFEIRVVRRKTAADKRR